MALTRRSALALLAATSLSGCSFEPIQWGPDTGGSTSGAQGKATEVSPTYFAQSPDSGTRSLSEGAPASQRISTPHFDARLDRTFIGPQISAETAAQIREESSLSAPNGYELVAFTLEAGTPYFAPAEGANAQVNLIIDDRSVPLQAPFGTYSESSGYVRQWALVVFCVPESSAVVLAVTDAEQTVQVDVRTGAPIADTAWQLTRGFRERVAVEITGGSEVLNRTIVTDPVNGQQLTFQFQLGIDPTAERGLVPWNPEDGWASEGNQWLRIAMNAKVNFVPGDQAVHVDLDVTNSFSYSEGDNAPVQPHRPKSIVTTEIQRAAAVLDVTWIVPGDADAATVRCSPSGTVQVQFSDHPTVRGDFSGAAPTATYQLAFATRQ